ncbi:MAG: hypothetical protein U0174_08020 [Polyangiaceae bacterium]
MAKAQVELAHHLVDGELRVAGPKSDPLGVIRNRGETANVAVDAATLTLLACAARVAFDTRSIASAKIWIKVPAHERRRRTAIVPRSHARARRWRAGEATDPEEPRYGTVEAE